MPARLGDVRIAAEAERRAEGLAVGLAVVSLELHGVAAREILPLLGRLGAISSSFLYGILERWVIGRTPSTAMARAKQPSPPASRTVASFSMVRLVQLAAGTGSPAAGSDATECPRAVIHML